MATSTSSPHNRSLALKAREKFVVEAGQTLGELRAAVRERLAVLVEEVRTAREMQDRRDIWTAYQQRAASWEAGTFAAWQKLLQTPSGAAAPRQTASTFELMGDDVVENKILASRLAQVIQDRTAQEFADFSACLQMLEGSDELASTDAARPETLMLGLVEQWAAAGLSRAALAMVNDVMQRELAAHLLDAYKAGNAFLSSNGITPSADLRGRVRRTDSASMAGGAASRPQGDGGQGDPSGWAASGRMGPAGSGAGSGGGGARGAPTQSGGMRGSG